ncbi:MAG: hypothetical protein PHI97_03860 [Desulfobulbus sp.]|nr:hypothetical protein [Desulfobulbus sp.]
MSARLELPLPGSQSIIDFTHGKADKPHTISKSSGNPPVEFVKDYSGKGGGHHKVIYKGVLRHGRIEGRWFTPGDGSGSFIINQEV